MLLTAITTGSRNLTPTIHFQLKWGSLGATGNGQLNLPRVGGRGNPTRTFSTHTLCHNLQLWVLLV